MAWQDEMLTILRVMVNDIGSTTYTDSTLTQVILVAAMQVNLELDFPNDYTVVVSQERISPDPTEDGSKDDSFVNLTCIKAACIIDRGAAILAAKQAISVKDGSSAIDLRGVLHGKLKLLEKGWCAVYDDAKVEYITTQAGGIAGAAVMTPFRLYARGGYSSGNLFTTDRSRDYY